MKQYFIWAILMVTLFSSCRKYRIQHVACKDDAYIGEGFGVPNIFSPNGDGNNDWFGLIHDSVPVTNFSITIKRGASIVFVSNEVDKQWAPGSSRVEGVYCYEIKFDRNGQHYHHKGTVTAFGFDYSTLTGEVCIKHFDNCLFPSHWYGYAFDPLLPNNENYECK